MLSLAILPTPSKPRYQSGERLARLAVISATCRSLGEPFVR